MSARPDQWAAWEHAARLEGGTWPGAQRDALDRWALDVFRRHGVTPPAPAARQASVELSPRTPPELATLLSSKKKRK